MLGRNFRKLLELLKILFYLNQETDEATAVDLRLISLQKLGK